jgi:hypothetical protein
MVNKAFGMGGNKIAYNNRICASATGCWQLRLLFIILLRFRLNVINFAFAFIISSSIFSQAFVRAECSLNTTPAQIRQRCTLP